MQSYDYANRKCTHALTWDDIAGLSARKSPAVSHTQYVNHGRSHADEH